MGEQYIMSDQILYYLKPSVDNVIRLNQIMWDNYVFKNGNYLQPFDEGTQNYYDVNNTLQLVTPELENAINDLALSQTDRDFIASQLANKKTRQQWVDAGAIILTPPAAPMG